MLWREDTYFQAPEVEPEAFEGSRYFDLVRGPQNFVGYLCCRHAGNRRILGWSVVRSGHRMATPAHNCRDCLAALAG